jgi:DNA polymerase (family 10)
MTPMKGNAEIASTLRELAVLYRLKGVQYKPRAFERAADVIERLGRDARDIYDEGGLPALEAVPGVGEGIAERIEEYLKTGAIAEHARLKKKLPVDIVGLTEIEGIGPKTLVRLYTSLKIKDRAGLERAARTGKLAKVSGIGPRGQERIIRAMRYLKESGHRTIPGFAWPHLKELAARIESWPHVKRLELVGSLRRMQETIGDLDMLAISDDADDTLRRFVGMPEVETVFKHGEHMALVRLREGMDADLWVLPEESYGAALIAWTGNKAHNIRIRTIALRHGMALDDFGLHKGAKMVAGATEEDVYDKLGMQWIPPEIRSDTGEVDAALKHTLPELVGYNDIKGDLQVQTDWTDGKHSILEMAKAAKAAGLEYIAITDHTKSLTIARGLDEKRVRAQWAEIDRVQKLVPGIKLLKGTECDILKDGALDWDEKTLAGFDVVGVSVHSYFDLPAAAQTARVVRAIEHPRAQILFHPTGRKINARPPHRMDIGDVIAAAKRTGTVLEQDAYPDRNDLKDEHVRLAVQAGVKISIDTDAHDVAHFQWLRWGIGTARRGWAKKSDVINTRPWRQMLKLLK